MALSVPNVSEPEPTLGDLRKELERLDRHLVELVARRLEVAERAVALRLTRGGRPTDRRQESRVRARLRAWAEAEGAPPELLDRLLMEIVGTAKRRAARPVRSVAVRAGLARSELPARAAAEASELA